MKYSVVSEITPLFTHSLLYTHWQVQCHATVIFATTKIGKRGMKGCKERNDEIKKEKTKEREHEKRKGAGRKPIRM